MKHLSHLAVFLVVSGWSAAALAQTQPRGAGHWQGTIKTATPELVIEIDLARTGDKWEGTMSVPAQSLKGLPLSLLTVDGNTITFAVKLPGEPQFKGTLSADGQSLSGDFSQFGSATPLVFARTGDAKIEPVPKSTPVTKDLEGSWEGTLDVKGTLLRLVLKLANQAGGTASGTLVSVDQGGAEIPVGAVVQTGTHLKLLVPAIAGSFEGDMKAGTLAGTWSQGPLTLPLTFTRSK